MDQESLTMLRLEILPLALLLFLYSFFEFFLKRILWDQRNQAFSWRRILERGAVLLAALAGGTFSCFSSTFFPYIGFVLLYLSYDFFVRHLPRQRSLESFVIKQALVGVAIYALWRLAGPYEAHGWYSSVVQNAIGVTHIYEWLEERMVHILVLASVYLFMVDGGTQFVHGILDKFPGLYGRALESLRSNEQKKKNSKNVTNKNGKGDENAGEWIGILERIITLTFVFTNSYTAIAFALTAKSIARFKELENKDFAEYYLLGTSSSVVLAVLAGMVVEIILSI